MAREKVTISGEPVGRLKAGWILFTETFRFLWLDKEMLWVPVISAIMNLFFFGLVVVALVLFALNGGAELPEDSPIWYVFAFLFYLGAAFTYAFSQAAITHIVYVRAHGGDATLGQGLKRALSHWFTLFLWSVITSTVGLILRAIAERSQLLGKLVAALLGVGWSVLTYFVVPAMVIDNKSAFASIGKSGQVFKDTWGETLTSNISYGIIYFLLTFVIALAFIGLMITTVAINMPIATVVLAVLFVIVMVFLILVSSAMAGVLKTLLYIYASEGNVPENFNRELLDKMLARKNPAPVEAVGDDAPPAQPAT